MPDTEKKQDSKDSNPSRTPIRGLPYVGGTDAVRVTPTISEEEMTKLSEHTHADDFIELTLLETEIAKAERELDGILETEIATIKAVSGEKDTKSDLVLLDNEPDTSPSISTAVSRTTTDRFFISNVYSSRADHDDVQVIRIRNVFRKLKDNS